jgi:heptosyltransferase-2
MTLDPQWIAAAEKLLGSSHGASPIAVAPAATHATKGWGPAKYAQLVKRVLPPGAPLVLVGGPNDAADLHAFRDELGAWAGLLDTSTLPLTTLAALLSKCRMLVGNDSGPIHLATLLGVPSVAVFGPTSVQRWGPPPYEDATHRAVSLRLSCSPCSNHGGKVCPLGHHHCMKQLTVERVMQEVEALTPSSVAPPSSLR